VELFFNGTFQLALWSSAEQERKGIDLSR
jgi:hypothetical protein